MSDSFSARSARPPSPTPSEQAKLDAEAKAREEAEQAALPYKWTQTLSEAEVTIPIPGNLKSKDLIVDIRRNHLKVQVKGQDAIIDVSNFDLTVQENAFITYTFDHSRPPAMRYNSPVLTSTRAPHLMPSNLTTAPGPSTPPQPAKK